jgi:hypothetical protein
MAKKQKNAAFERGQVLWFLTPVGKRTAVRVLDELNRDGLKVSKATVSRWAKEWQQTSAESVHLMPLAIKGSAIADADDLSDIPAWAKRALPERLWQVAKGRGLTAWRMLSAS